MRPQTERFDWLLQNSITSLRVLRFEDLVDKRLLLYFAQRFGKQLESLTLLKRPDTLSMFPALRELVLGWVNAGDMEAVWCACPSEIQHFAIRGITVENVDALRDLATTSTSLRAITYSNADCDIAELQEACNRKGIVLRRCCRYPPRVQPLRAPDFPRLTLISNFRRMQM